MRALRVACHIHLLPEVALGGVGHERVVTREVEREEPPLLTVVLGGFSCRFNGRWGESFELLLVAEKKFESLVLLQQILRELQREHAGFFRELAQPGFPLVVQQGSTAHEALVAFLQKGVLLGSKLTVVLVDILVAFEETLVQGYIIRVFGEDGTHLLGQGIEVVAGLCAEHAREDIRHPVEEVVVMLAFRGVHMDDGILESGCRRVVDNLVDFLIVAAYTFHESLLVVGCPDTVERHRVVRCVIGNEKGIYMLLFLLLIFIHTNLVAYISCKNSKNIRYTLLIR